MYLDYWGLKEKPFVNTPDPKFLCETRQHMAALQQMEIAVEERMSAAMLFGVPGTGKTLIANTLSERLDSDRFATYVISRPQSEPIELLLAIAMALGDDSLPMNRSELLVTAILSSIERSIESNRDKGQDSVLIIDEAHLLKNEDVLEQLRLLLNLQLTDRPLLTLLLFGQPELQKSIDRVEQLEQRIGMKCSLQGLTRQESEVYINHRLKIARREEPVFNSSALDLVFEFSSGIPREINRLSVLCLIAGASEKSPVVDERIAWDQVRNLTSGEFSLTTLQESGIAAGKGDTVVVEEAMAAAGEEAMPEAGEEEVPVTLDQALAEAAGEGMPAVTLRQRPEELYEHAMVVTKGIFNRARHSEEISSEVMTVLMNRLIDDLARGSEQMMELFFQTYSDDYLHVHAVNSAVLNIVFGLHLKLGQEELIRVGLCGLLHSIGLVKSVEHKHWVRSSTGGIPFGDTMVRSLGLDKIVEQPRVLTEEERGKLRNEPVYAREIIESIPDIDPQVADIIYQHRERADGEGYPEGLAGEEIHPHAQLTSLCCVFEALTHPRRHRGKRFPDEAIEILTDQAGKNFNPDLVAKLINCFGVYPVSWWVELSTGEVGKVIRVNQRFPMRPVVEILFDSKGKRLAQPKLIDLSEVKHDRIVRMIEAHLE